MGHNAPIFQFCLILITVYSACQAVAVLCSFLRLAVTAPTVQTRWECNLFSCAGSWRVLTAIAVAQCQWAHSCTPWNEDGNAVVSLNGQSIASNTDATKVVGPDVKQKTKELCLCMRMTFVCMSFPITDAGCR